MDKKKLHYLAIPEQVVTKDPWKWNDSLKLDDDELKNVAILPMNILGEGDCADLMSLFKECFSSADKYYNTIRHAEYVAIVRNNDLVAIGAAFLCGRNCMSIEHVSVHPNYRKMGIASHIVKNLIDYTFTHMPEVPHLTLVSKPSLRGLYEGCGFKVVAES